MRLRLAAYIASDVKTSKNWRKKYYKVWKFIDGFAKVKIKHKYGEMGFVNRKGEEVVPPKYDDVRDFHKGFARVKLGDKWGYVNTQGEEVVRPKYNEVYGFYNGFSKVELKGKWGLINTQGEEVIPPKYYTIDFRNGLAVVRLNGKEGFLNEKGKEVVPLKYDAVDYFHEGFARVELDNKWGFVNTKGVEVVPPMYNEKEWTQLKALVDTGEYEGTEEQQYNQAHEEFQIWKKENKS